MKKITVHIGIERETPSYYHCTLDVLCAVSPGSPARTHGLPENCYEADPGSIDILSVKCNGQVFGDELTESEVASVREKVMDYLDDDDDLDDEYAREWDEDRDDFAD
jgi:hypothetical protein